MNLKLFSALLLSVFAFSSSFALAESPWTGVDETVVERVASDSGRPPRDPYINTDQGDMLLFLFLLSGTVGGFIAGYSYRGLFVREEGGCQSDARPR